MENKYIPSRKKFKKEKNEDFISRIQSETNNNQKIEVEFNKQRFNVSFGMESPIITPYGIFQMVPARVDGGRWGRHYFLFYPNLKTLLRKKKMLLRIDSGCFSGMVLGDITCDCLEQLRISQKACVASGGGIVIEIPGQDGRGWGGDKKMATQRLMHELNITTAEASRAFYERDDLTDIRTYDECAIILKAFGFTDKHCFEMATNNPKKIKGFKNMGMNVDCVKSVTVQHPNNFVKRNLESKRKFWNHDFNHNKLKIKGGKKI